MDTLVFASREYGFFLALLLAARGLDFFSTWLGTPHLLLEANPLAKKLGWRWGLLLNAVLCFVFAFWPLPTLIIVTSSLLVASRNFQSAWLMRIMGEDQYRGWMSERLAQTPFALYSACVLAQTFVFGSLGLALTIWGFHLWVPFAIGVGMITYALAVTLYSLRAAWYLRRR